MLRDRRVGCLVVVRGAEVEGLFSEREVGRRVVAEGLDAARTPVRDVMVRSPAVIGLEASCEDVEAVLRGQRARYVPVVGARGLLGMVSVGDLARFYALRARLATPAAAEQDPAANPP